VLELALKRNPVLPGLWQREPEDVLKLVGIITFCCLRRGGSRR